jgi:GH24 family phage-related lysozyme (muramidase)
MSDVQNNENEVFLITLVIFVIIIYFFSNGTDNKGYVYSKATSGSSVYSIDDILLKLQSTGNSMLPNVSNVTLDIPAAVDKFGSKPQVTNAAKVMKLQLGNCFGRITSMNDQYHKKLGYSSAHKTGEAFDFTVTSYISCSKQVYDTVATLRQAYNVTFYDEYLYPSTAATGPHFHLTVKIKEVITSNQQDTEFSCNVSSLIELVKCNEGYRSTVYTDDTGNRTVCYGHNLDAVPLPYSSYNRNLCNQVLLEDIVYFKTILISSYNWWLDLDEPTQAAVFYMLYNLGEHRFKKFQNGTLRLLRNGEKKQAVSKLFTNRFVRNQSGNITDAAKRLKHLILKGWIII